ncbi:MAG: NAD(P)-dependent oxidoreductase, partial [Microthrixaceae bacterium]
MSDTFESDYVVVGAGAMGLAFTDVLLAETDATVTIIDRRDRPGGHWNDAYPFVRLHQPSAFYGVNSTELSNGHVDDRGWNEGLAELASAPDVLSYYQRVLQHILLPSGRVRYLPLHEYTKDLATSLVTGEVVDVVATKRTVDCTYMNVQVPSMQAPRFKVDPEAACIPPNDLPKLSGANRFVLVGGGKTSIDAALWLLDHGVATADITWVRPRDAWLLDRRNVQPDGSTSLRSYSQQLEASAKAESVEDLFARLEAGGDLLRMDEAVTPTMYRCATVTQREVEALRGITDVVRAGHVKEVTPKQIVLDEAEIDGSGAVVVNCSSDGLAKRPPMSIFDGERITAQAVRSCQQVFSAAFLGHLEAAYDDDETRNSLAKPVPHPNDDVDWLRSTLDQLTNQIGWAADADLTSWLRASRLDPFSSSSRNRDAASTKSIGKYAFGAVENLTR